MSTTASRKPVIGFIGIGKMGAPMATNLVKAGFPVKVFNRTASATKPLQELGAIAVTNVCDLADVDILFTIVANHTALQEAVVDSGLLGSMASKERPQPLPWERQVHVSCATLPVTFVKNMARQHDDAGVEYVALPVLGRPDAAAAAKLHLLFAGKQSIIPFLQPILVPAVGQSLRNYGAEPEKANVMKIVFNMTLACAIEAISEGSALVQKHGCTTEQYTSLLSETLFDCAAYKGYGNMIASHQFVPAGASLTGVGLKDCKLALEAGEESGVPLPFASILRNCYLEAIANGMGEWDWCAISTLAENHAGINKK